MLRTFNFPLFKLFVIGMIFLTLTGMLWSARLLLQDLRFTAVATEVSFWGRGNYQPLDSTINNIKGELDALLQSQPDNPDFLGLEANTMAWLSYWAPTSKKSREYIKRAITAQTLALRSRPAHRQNWVKLIDYASRSPNGVEIKEQAKRRLEILQRWTEHQ